MAHIRFWTAFDLTRSTAFPLIEFDEDKPYVQYENGLRLYFEFSGHDIFSDLTLSKSGSPLIEFENFSVGLGGWADAHVIGAGGKDVVNGFAGNDRIDGRGGDDRLIGGAGADLSADDFIFI